MSKKKKKKGNKQKGGINSISILNEVDKSLDTSYQNLLEEIQDYQMEIYIADQRARKKARKKLQKDPYYFNNNKERFKERRKVIQKMESGNFFDRIENFIKELTPIVIVISRLVASLILSILSLDMVKTRINPRTLGKLKDVYELATSIC